MPTTSRDARLVLSRRAALGLVAGTALVSGCTPKGVDRRAKPTPSAPPTPEEDPDVALAARVLAGEQALLDRVTATVRRHPGLRARLSAAEAAHRAHVRLLTEAVPDRTRTPTPTPAPTASATPTGRETPAPAASAPTSAASPSAPVVPRRAGPALAVLAREEGRLSVVDKRSSFAAESGAFARVLASMAASAAQHAAILTAAAARENR